MGLSPVDLELNVQDPCLIQGFIPSTLFGGTPARGHYRYLLNTVE